jgi:hypothetical protein
MNKSKYNPKLDPKSTSYQPHAVKASVTVPVTAPSVSKNSGDATTQMQNSDNKTGTHSLATQSPKTQPLRAAWATEAVPLKDYDAVAEKKREDAKANYQGSLGGSKAAGSTNNKDMEEDVSQGPTAAGATGRSNAEMHLGQPPVDGKANKPGTAVASAATAMQDAKSSEEMVNEGGHTASGDKAPTIAAKHIM